jgi:hypothetical protein
LSLARITTLSTAALGPDNGPPGRAVAWEVVLPGLTPPLRAAVHARAQVGIHRYGGPLRIGWPWATVGALQEAVDLVVYLEADETATTLERGLARELAELLVARIGRVPASIPLALVELTGDP